MSPITDQALRAYSFFGKKPEQTLTGVICPFRTPQWKDLSAPAKKAALDLGKQFWTKHLSQPSMKLIICSGQDATKAVADWLKAPLMKSGSAAWGDVKIHAYRAPTGTTIIGLPHLSRYKLFGRPESEQAIAALLQ